MRPFINYKNGEQMKGKEEMSWRGNFDYLLNFGDDRETDDLFQYRRRWEVGVREGKSRRYE